ncbi:MAG: hypothetical protein ACJA2W_003258 [Planctomycetota bacterium]
MLCILLAFALSGPCPQSGGAVVHLSPDAPDLRDPRLDGWTTEAFAEDVGAVLKRWKESLAHGIGAQLAADGPSRASGRLRLPDIKDLTTVRSSGSITSRRWQAGDLIDSGDPRRAAAGLGELAALMRGPLHGDGHVLIKVTGVHRPAAEGDPWNMALLLEVGGRSNDRGWHASATATSSWQASDDEPQLIAFSLETFESTELRIEGGQLLEDVTEAVLGDDPAWQQQLLVGQDRWARTIEERLGMGLYKHCGIAVGDANGDGLEDLYVAQPAGVPNLLLLKAADGGLRNAAEEAGVYWLDHTASALLVDLDGDGDLDLAATVAGALLVQENTGTKDGIPRYSAHPPLHSEDTDLYGLSAADIDLDGDLDLYVTADFANKRRDGSTAERARFDYVDANDGGRNVLWRNEGQFRFTDATEALGLDVHNQRHSLAATWRDLDRDGDVDLYVANDYGHNCLYVNRSELGSGRVGPLFQECATACGVEDRGSGMSVDVGDPNRDGKLDLLVANMWSSAGRRVVPQVGFGAAANAAERDQFSRFAKGNTLFLSAARGEEPGASVAPFTEASQGENIERGRWAWGTPFIDLDGDGWEDMLVGNGYVTSHDPGDL